MNYHNYEAKIVEKYGVELQGWPTSNPGICNPATLGGRTQLEKLLAVLESGKCHWVVLSDGELDERKKRNQAREERGEQVYRPHKSTKRKGHSNPKGAKSAEMIDDDDDDEATRTHLDDNGDEQGSGDNTAIDGDD